MGLRATGFWLVAGALLAAGILVFAAASLWLAFQQAHVLVVIVGVALIVGLMIAGLIFGWSWLRWAFREARARGESMREAIVNVARLALATRRGRAALGVLAFGIAIGASPALIRAVQLGRLGDVIIPGLLLASAIFLNALAIGAAGSAVLSDAKTKGLAKWERVFAVEDAVGPEIDFDKQTEIRLRVKPLRGNQWRFGLKFSRSDEFSTGRYAPGYPLWHVQKEQESSDLVFTYYDELARGKGALIWRGYRDEEIIVVIRRMESQLVIKVDGGLGWTGAFEARSHRYAQPTAWADGREFQIRVQLEVLSTGPIRVADPPILRMDDHLTTDTATRHHAAYFRLRFWNDGGSTITPEVRVTKLLLGDEAREAKFSPQLPLLLGWSSLAAPPGLTRQHTAGETVGVLGALNWVDRGDGTGAPLDPPLLYVAGEEHNPEIGQTDEKVFVQIQAIVPGHLEIATIERWFWVQIAKADERKGRYVTTGRLDEAPPGAKK
jgi:hypothetical protein